MITFELREVGSLVPIDNAAYISTNDQNPGVDGVQIYTNSEGAYELFQVPTGIYNLIVKTNNYLTGQRKSLDIVPGDLEDIELQVALSE